MLAQTGSAADHAFQFGKRRGNGGGGLERRVLERLARMPVHEIVARGSPEPTTPSVGLTLERTRGAEG